MSYKFCGTAVQASVDKVTASLKDFATSRGGCLEEADCLEPRKSDYLYFQFGAQGSWSLIGWLHGQRLIPDIVLHLSADLKTTVISVDQVQSAGYEHFSWLEIGKEKMVFTLHDDVHDLLNVDYAEFIARGASSGKFKLKKGLTEDDYFMYMFAIFNSVISPIDVEGAVANLFGDKDGPCFRMLCRGLEEHSIGVTPETFWDELVRRPFVPLKSLREVSQSERNVIETPALHPVDVRNLPWAELYFRLFEDEEEPPELPAEIDDVLKDLSEQLKSKPHGRFSASDVEKSVLDRLLNEFMTLLWTYEIPLTRKQLLHILRNCGCTEKMAEQARLKIEIDRSLMFNSLADSRFDPLLEKLAYSNFALALDPTNWALYITRAQIFTELQQFDKALEDLNKSIEIYPDDRGTYLLRATVHLGLGDPKAAKADKSMADEKLKPRTKKPDRQGAKRAKKKTPAQKTLRKKDG